MSESRSEIFGDYGLIASVSYNGVKLATTGDTGSRWMYKTDSNLDESLWTPADTTGLCDTKTSPAMNQDGLSYSEVISANGVTPASNTPQYGGKNAHWIGVNGNNGTCSLLQEVTYRMTLNLTELADEPSCLPKHDARSILSAATPFRSSPSIGLKTTTSRKVTFVGSSNGEIDVWVDGILSYAREINSDNPVLQVNQFDYNIEPKTHHLIAIYVLGSTKHSLIANILYEGQLYAASDSLAQWKLLNGPSKWEMNPGNGWNTDPEFDDSRWDDMSDTIVCNSEEPESLSHISLFLNKTYGGCANWFWYSSGCNYDSESTEGFRETRSLYVRIRMNLGNLASRPSLQCPEKTREGRAPEGPVRSLTQLEIVAIASSASIGSLIMIAMFLFARRFRARRSKTKNISDLVYVRPSIKQSKQASTPNSKKWAIWSETQSATTSQSSKMNLTDLSAADINARPPFMGELQATLAVRSNSKLHSAASTVQFHSDLDTKSLIFAYREKIRSAYTRMPGLQESSETRKLTRTQGTRTDRTLVDRSRQGLEVPGFLQIKQGLNYNLDSKLVSGGGGSLYRGHMFAQGLPNLNVIVKKMTNTSLPAFRQEVALMWLLNDNENVVKLMGFNEIQLAIVMPEYKMGSLKRFINADDYDIKVARSLLIDIAKGLSTMHERGVVHNDIKPDNILLEPHPTRRVRALLTDFGISNVVEDKVLTVKAFDVKNRVGLTLGYAAPEAIARFRNKDLSRVSPGEAKAGDVYSFAIVVHALLVHLRLP